VFKTLFNGWESFYNLSIQTFYLPLHISLYIIILQKVITYTVLFVSIRKSKTLRKQKKKKKKKKKRRAIIPYNKIYTSFILL